MQLKKTIDNLKDAFAGESQANRKYSIFAEKAEEEDQPRIARLFRAASDAEAVHARNHLKAMKELKTTADNLAAAIGGENYEFTKMYPMFIKQAEEDDANEAANSFKMANKVERIHHDLYKGALEAMQNGQPKELKPFYVCQYCGNTIEGEAPDRCPVCGRPRKMFKLVE
jgi:rubrerythrin